MLSMEDQLQRSDGSKHLCRTGKLSFAEFGEFDKRAWVSESFLSELGVSRVVPQQPDLKGAEGTARRMTGLHKQVDTGCRRLCTTVRLAQCLKGREHVFASFESISRMAR